jgi:ankyrin repeat protein
MAADSVNEPVGEGTDNRPDSSLLGRYMHVPMAHFGTPGGCEEVVPRKESDCSACAVARITRFLRATAVARKSDTFEAIVDLKNVDKVTAYIFTPGQVLAYIEPIDFQPTTEHEENLAYEHADIGRQEVATRSEPHAEDEADDADHHDSNGASDGSSDTDEEATTWDPFCETPCGRRIHKSALVAEINRCLGMGIALSPDRLIAVRGGPSDAFAAQLGANKVKADVNRNVITRGCHVIVEAQADGDANKTRYYIARISRMRKRFVRGTTQYHNAVTLGGTPKSDRGSKRTHFFPLEVTADSPGAKGLEVQLVWMNHVPGAAVFKLGGSGGDMEWYDAHTILGTIDLEPYIGHGTKALCDTPCPGNGWDFYFSIVRGEKKDVEDLLQVGGDFQKRSARAKKVRKKEKARSNVHATEKCKTQDLLARGVPLEGRAVRAKDREKRKTLLERQGEEAKKTQKKSKTRKEAEVDKELDEQDVETKRKSTRNVVGRKARDVSARGLSARTRQRCTSRPPTQKRVVDPTQPSCLSRRPRKIVKFDSTLGYPGEGPGVTRKRDEEDEEEKKEEEESAEEQEQKQEENDSGLWVIRDDMARTKRMATANLMTLEEIEEKEKEEGVEGEEEEEKKDEKEDEEEEDEEKQEEHEGESIRHRFVVSMKQCCLFSKLLKACESGSAEDAGEVIQQGVWVGMTDLQKGTATAAAVVSGNPSLVRLLITLWQPDSERTTMYPTLHLFLARRGLLGDPPGLGETMLMVASRKGNGEIVRMLLGMGATTEDVDEQGYTALLLACEAGHKVVVKLLVAWGANPNSTSEHTRFPYCRYSGGVTLQPLVMAVFHERTHVVRTLIASGRLVPTGQVLGLCLNIAASNGDGDMCLLLGSIDGADLRGGNDIDTHGVKVEWRAHADVAEAMGHSTLGFHLRGEIRGNMGGTVVLRGRGPPPLNSKVLFWRDDYAAFVHDGNTRTDQAYCAMRHEWRVHVAQCSRRARLELMMAKASPRVNPAIKGVLGLVLPPDAVSSVMTFLKWPVGLVLPSDAVSCVMAFVLPAHYTSRAGPPTAGPRWPTWATGGPRLALVACTLAYNLVQEIEGGYWTDMSPITHVQQQMAARGVCEWLDGYCEFLRDWWGSSGDMDD